MSKTITAKKPKVDLELTFEQKLARWKKRDLSWSQLSSFEYDPDQWYRRYFEKEEQHETEEMRFGKIIGERLAADPTFLPEVPRLKKFEHGFKVMFGKIPLVGYADSFCTTTKKKLLEYKTGVKAWDKKRADDHGQIDMYLLMHFITERIKPEDVECRIVWLPTERREDGDFKVSIKLKEPVKDHMQIFKTKRTMQDILNFGARINRVYKEMEEYAKGREQLSPTFLA